MRTQIFLLLFVQICKLAVKLFGRAPISWFNETEKSSCTWFEEHLHFTYSFGYPTVLEGSSSRGKATSVTTHDHWAAAAIFGECTETRGVWSAVTVSLSGRKFPDTVSARCFSTRFRSAEMGLKMPVLAAETHAEMCVTSSGQSSLLLDILNPFKWFISMVTVVNFYFPDRLRNLLMLS